VASGPPQLCELPCAVSFQVVTDGNSLPIMGVVTLLPVAPLGATF
jgi:hypothetical protein